MTTPHQARALQCLADEPKADIHTLLIASQIKGGFSNEASFIYRLLLNKYLVLQLGPSAVRCPNCGGFEVRLLGDLESYECKDCTLEFVPDTIRR